MFCSVFQQATDHNHICYCLHCTLCNCIIIPSGLSISFIYKLFIVYKNVEYDEIIMLDRKCKYCMQPDCKFNFVVTWFLELTLNTNKIKECIQANSTDRRQSHHISTNNIIILNKESTRQTI